jgi:nucleoid-associated protein YgaU
MGLFDFVKDVGRKLFSKEEEAAQKIQEHIEESNPGVDDLSVSFDGGVVKLEGQASDAAAMEKAVLMAGNVAGVESVDAAGLASPPPDPETRYYVVEKGDTLSAIARQFYGNANDYPRIFEANREVIKDPDLIFPGQKIRIP